MSITTDSQVTWIHQINSTVQEMNSKIFRQLLKHVNSNKTPSGHAHRLTTGLFSLIERETNTGGTNHVVAYTSSGQIQLLNAQLFHEQRDQWYALLDNTTTNQPPRDLLMTRITQIRDNAKQQLSAGGRNYVLSSKDERYVSTNTTAEAVLIYALSQRLEQNTTYTLSAYVKASQNVRDIEMFYLSILGHSKRGVLRNTFGDWTRVVFTFVTSETVTGNQIRFDNNGSTNGQTATLWVRDVKLEKGTIATDWTPAVEEVGVEEDL